MKFTQSLNGLCCWWLAATPEFIDRVLKRNTKSLNMIPFISESQLAVMPSADLKAVPVIGTIGSLIKGAFGWADAVAHRSGAPVHGVRTVIQVGEGLHPVDAIVLYTLSDENSKERGKTLGAYPFLVTSKAERTLFDNLHQVLGHKGLGIQLSAYNGKTFGAKTAEMHAAFLQLYQAILGKEVVKDVLVPFYGPDISPRQIVPLHHPIPRREGMGVGEMDQGYRRKLRLFSLNLELPLSPLASVWMEWNLPADSIPPQIHSLVGRNATLKELLEKPPFDQPVKELSAMSGVNVSGHMLINYAGLNEKGKPNGEEKPNGKKTPIHGHFTPSGFSPPTSPSDDPRNIYNPEARSIFPYFTNRDRSPLEWAARFFPKNPELINEINASIQSGNTQAIPNMPLRVYGPVVTVKEGTVVAWIEALHFYLAWLDATRVIEPGDGCGIVASMTKDGPVVLAVPPLTVSPMKIGEKPFYGGVVVITPIGEDRAMLSYLREDGVLGLEPSPMTERLATMTACLAVVFGLHHRMVNHPFVRPHEFTRKSESVQLLNQSLFDASLSVGIRADDSIERGEITERMKATARWLATNAVSEGFGSAIAKALTKETPVMALLSSLAASMKVV